MLYVVRVPMERQAVNSTFRPSALVTAARTSSLPRHFCRVLQTSKIPEQESPHEWIHFYHLIGITGLLHLASRTLELIMVHIYTVKQGQGKPTEPLPFIWFFRRKAKVIRPTEAARPPGLTGRN